MKLLARIALACACLTPLAGTPAHATPDLSVTAGPLLGGIGAYSYTNASGLCTASTAVVAFEAEFLQGTGFASVVSQCGEYHVAFLQGQCNVITPPQEGVLCLFDGPDGSSGFVRTFSRTNNVRKVGAGVTYASGLSWGFLGAALGVN